MPLFLFFLLFLTACATHTVDGTSMRASVEPLGDNLYELTVLHQYTPVFSSPLEVAEQNEKTAHIVMKETCGENYEILKQASDPILLQVRFRCS